VAPSQGIQHPAEAASEDGDHSHNGQNGRGNADTGQPSIEPPHNREKIPENRECKEAVGYGHPPVASRFRPGRSGNPGGRPRKLVISERYLETSEKKLPKEIRLQIEGKLKIKLPKGITFGDALSQVTWMSALGCFELGRGLMATKEIREAIEGKATQRTWVLQPLVQQDGDELRKHILGKLVEISYKRHKLYNMPMPGLEKMASDAGVSVEEFEEAMDDKKPSPPEATIGDEEP
jgi:hypothetical protein